MVKLSEDCIVRVYGTWTASGVGATKTTGQEAKITAVKRLLALVEAVAVDLDPEYGPDAELLAELPELKAKILG